MLPQFFFHDTAHQDPILTNPENLHAVHVGFQHSIFSYLTINVSTQSEPHLTCKKPTFQHKNTFLWKNHVVHYRITKQLLVVNKT